MPINSASTKKELVEYLRDVHGVDTPDGTKDDLLKQIGDLEGIDYTNTNTSAPAAKVKKGMIDPALLDADPLKHPRVKIRIPSTDTSKDDVFVGVNGYNFVIQRDQDVDVPQGVYEILNNSLMSLYRQEGPALVERKVHMHPFILLQ